MSFDQLSLVNSEILMNLYNCFNMIFFPVLFGFPFLIHLFISFIGGPLLLMELAFLLRGVGADVHWITNQKPSETDNVIYSLEHKMLNRGVQVLHN